MQGREIAWYLFMIRASGTTSNNANDTFWNDIGNACIVMKLDDPKQKSMSCSTIERMDSRKVRFSETIETYEAEQCYDGTSSIRVLQASQLVHDLQKYARNVFHKILFTPFELSDICKRLSKLPRKHQTLHNEARWKHSIILKIIDIKTNCSETQILEEDMILRVLL
jgi:hypothetical protein